MRWPRLRWSTAGRLTSANGRGFGLTQLRWCLGLLWILDAGLQLQPGMFTSAFSSNVLYNAALMYQPPGLESFLMAMASRAAAHVATVTVVIAIIQLTIGLAILYPRTLRWGLMMSVVWATLVWIFGEGLGFMATGTALIEFGAPGSAVLYAVLSWLAWPRAPERAGRRPGLPPKRPTLWVWSGFWALGALLHIPVRYSMGAVLAYNLQIAAQANHGALGPLDYRLAQAAWAQSGELTAILVLVELALAVGVWLPAWRRPTLMVGIILNVLFWVFFQSLGGLLSGLSTDPDTAPLIVLLALCIWPVVDSLKVAQPSRGEVRRQPVGTATPSS